MKLTAVAISLLLVLSASRAFCQTATRAEFEEFCEEHAGRWVGEVVLTTGSPGLAKKDDKVTVYWDGYLAADGNTIDARFYRGSDSVVSMRYYDPGVKRIKQVGVESDGTVTHGIFYKEDGLWKYSGISTGADGTRREFSLWATFTDDGETVTWQGSIAVGGKVTKEIIDTYQRVDKPR